jgi:hypothetical protein
MGAAKRIFVAGLLASILGFVPVKAQEVLRPLRPSIELTRGCLSPWERRALVESGTVLRLAAAIYNVRTKVPGILVRARLCRRPEGLVYVLIVLAHDGKVTHVVVDAVKGTLVGER